MNTITATEVKFHLSDNDLRVLDGIPTGGWSMTARSEATAWYAKPAPSHRAIAQEWTGALLDAPSAVIVYKSAHDASVQFGVARCRREFDGVTYYEVSPFPGGWETITHEQVMAVRHTHAI